MGLFFKEKKGLAFKRPHEFIWENDLEVLEYINIFCKSGELE